MQGEDGMPGDATLSQKAEPPTTRIGTASNTKATTPALSLASSGHPQDPETASTTTAINPAKTAATPSLQLSRIVVHLPPGTTSTFMVAPCATTHGVV